VGDPLIVSRSAPPQIGVPHPFTHFAKGWEPPPPAPPPSPNSCAARTRRIRALQAPERSNPPRRRLTLVNHCSCQRSFNLNPCNNIHPPQNCRQFPQKAHTIRDASRAQESPSPARINSSQNPRLFAYIFAPHSTTLPQPSQRENPRQHCAKPLSSPCPLITYPLTTPSKISKKNISPLVF